MFQGVIFSIFYNPLLKLISSTSDDRTIRVWKITDEFNKSLQNFNWDNVKINLKTTIYGHSARVWRSIILDDDIISIGEVILYLLEIKFIDIKAIIIFLHFRILLFVFGH